MKNKIKAIKLLYILYRLRSKYKEAIDEGRMLQHDDGNLQHYIKYLVENQLQYGMCVAVGDTNEYLFSYWVAYISNFYELFRGSYMAPIMVDLGSYELDGPLGRRTILPDLTFDFIINKILMPRYDRLTSSINELVGYIFLFKSTPKFIHTPIKLKDF